MIRETLLNWLNSLVPPYTEQWATTYLQVLFESFLFALGVPTAIYSLIVDNDIKRVAQTRVKARRYFIVTALLYVAVFVIVWFLHPEPTPPQCCPPPAEVQAASSRQEATSTTTPLASQPPVSSPERAAETPPQRVQVSSPAATPQAGKPKPSSIAKSLFAASTVTFLPFAVLLTGLWLNSQFKRKKVVERLARELLKSLDAERNIDTVTLRDLSYLGEHGQAGEEKAIVLDVIDRLAETVQLEVKMHRLNYKGYELESLIRHIPAMLDNSSQPGNDENYRRAVEVLANIWRWLGTRNVSDDALSTREALTHLALRSIEKTTEETSLAYLEIAADCDCQMVFDMGLAAIKTKKYSLAVAALTKLEASASNAMENKFGPDGAREIKANLLGITALLASEGPSGSLRAETSLSYNENLFAPSLRSALADAFAYHYEAGNFEIADKISFLVAETRRMNTVDLDRTITFASPAFPDV